MVGTMNFATVRKSGSIFDKLICMSKNVAAFSCCNKIWFYLFFPVDSVLSHPILSFSLSI